MNNVITYTPKPPEVETPPRDMDGNIITEGCQILFPTGSGGVGDKPAIRRGTVLLITAPKYRGYGYWSHTLIVTAPDGKKKIVSYPANTLVIGE
jgi:hypothetical protein